MRDLAKHIFDAKELLQPDVIATLEMEVKRRQFVISVADVLVLRKATDDLPWDFLLQLLKRLDPASRDIQIWAPTTTTGSSQAHSWLQPSK